MIRTTLAILAIAAALYGALCAVLYFQQRSLIYFPQPRTPVHGLDTFELKAPDDTKLVISVRLREGADAIIYFGGNAEDVSLSQPTLASAFPDHAQYLMHYRGYGGSQGTPSEAALMGDALALFDHVHRVHRHVIVIGRSLGSGVAVQVASARPVARLILVTPYNSILELAQQHMPFVPVGWLLLDRFESWRFAPRISAPTTIVAAEFDEVIPMASTRALYRQFPVGIAKEVLIAGSGHNTISTHPEYLLALRGSP